MDFRGLREIGLLCKPEKRAGVTCVLDHPGQEIYDKDEIVEVFASFYDHLYASTPTNTTPASDRIVACSISFTIEELRTALKKMKNGDAKDVAGIVADMLKYGGESLHEAILNLFNDILLPDALPPVSWKRMRLTVIYKKGDCKLVQNYRPIAMIPILYKLFSRMLCNRIQDQVLKELSPDQAAYRPGFSTEDHLTTLTLLFERCREWNREVWLGQVGFEKAFDTVEHEELWEVLHDVGASECYIQILRRLYSQQAATVVVGSESRPFALRRGVKQGDPISGLLALLSWKCASASSN